MKQPKANVKIKQCENLKMKDEKSLTVVENHVGGLRCSLATGFGLEEIG